MDETQSGSVKIHYCEKKISFSDIEWEDLVKSIFDAGIVEIPGTKSLTFDMNSNHRKKSSLKKYPG